MSSLATRNIRFFKVYQVYLTPTWRFPTSHGGTTFVSHPFVDGKISLAPTRFWKMEFPWRTGNHHVSNERTKTRTNDATGWWLFYLCAFAADIPVYIIIYIYTYISSYVYVHMCIFICSYMFIFMYSYVHQCMYLYIYIIECVAGNDHDRETDYRKVTTPSQGYVLSSSSSTTTPLTAFTRVTRTSRIIRRNTTTTTTTTTTTEGTKKKT